MSDIRKMIEDKQRCIEKGMVAGLKLACEIVRQEGNTEDTIKSIESIVLQHEMALYTNIKEKTITL